jgi:hypothetical protein
MDEDALAKIGLEALLSPFVEVRTQHPVQPPAQFVDVFVASEHCDKVAMWEALGWLGKMACQSTLIEVFSRAVPEDAARDCVRKQLSLHHELTLASKEDPVPLPRLWLLSNGCPTTLLQNGWMRPMVRWPHGFYEGPPWLAHSVVVLQELPKTRETLPLRIFASDDLRLEIAQEFRLLAPTDPLWRAVSQMLFRWGVWLRGQPEDDRKRRLVMELEQMVQAEVRRIRYEGFRDGLRQTITDLCEVFGIEVTPERITHIESLDQRALEALRLVIKRQRAWPS